MVPYVPDVHPALRDAPAAAVAAVRIHFPAGEGETAEKAVEGPQGADEPAEGPVAEDAGQPDDAQDHPFVGEDGAQLIEGGAVGGMLQVAHRALQGAGRADVFAESRQDFVLSDAEPDRDRDDENSQEHIFQVRKHPGDPALPDFRRGDFVQQLLDQPQGAEPAADRPAEDHAEEGQDAQDVPRRGMPGGVQRVLQGTQGAAGDGAGAGIAVEPGDADGFQIAGIDMPVDIAFEIRVVQQGGVELYEAAGARPEAHLIQGRYTPCRWRRPSPGRLPCRR